MSQDEKLVLRLPELERALGVKRTCIDDMVRKGDLPKPIPLGPRSKGWLAAEIREWLQNRASLRDHEEVA